ncbi:helicase-exonuclease AddAB subunit AddB [Virgibacillus halophilus]|uniref:helicase-exonuclease AddAB subunit AddB n=1 Tax=Tigheibacillus halophilus TaxID=361280 RepID=UPI00362CD1C4
MGIRFVVGRAGTDKNAFLTEEIKQKSKDEPQGPPIYYLVPEQMTFDQEYALFGDHEFCGSIRTQVFSFSRLAWRILQETGGATRQFISSIGIQMMLRKIIEQKSEKWHIFQKATEKQGFLEQVEKMITEFKRYQVTPEILQMQLVHMQGFVHKEPGERALIEKLDDLLYIYEKLNLALAGNYIDSEDQLQLLAEKIGQADSLKRAEIYIAGFHQFTPQELEVVKALLKQCRCVTVALTTDIETQSLSELHLFHQTSETYHALKQLAEDNGIAVEDTVILDTKQGKFINRPYFAHLEENFDTRPAPAYRGDVPIKIAEAVHPRAEVEAAAQEIVRLVREKKYRFRDIVVLNREAPTYHDLIATIFGDYDIPVFIDEKRPMIHHPLIEFIRSALEAVEGDWRYDAVFRMLKTGFVPAADKKCPLNSDAVDELEDYVLEYGIRGRKRWFSDEPWVFRRFHGFDQKAQTDSEKKTQERLNIYRKQVLQGLKEFDENVRGRKTIEERCIAIYTLLEKIDVPQRLETMRSDYDDAGEIEKGREQEQVWNALIQLFDEIVEMAGTEKISLHDFAAMLEAGLDTLKFAHVPPSMDHVIVGSLERTRIGDKNCAFLLGVNEGIWPMKPATDSVINEQERELLTLQGMQLADTSKRKLLDDWFYMYLALTSATDYLWISYPLSNEEGKTLLPSTLIRRVGELFPACAEHILIQDADEQLNTERFITTPTKTRAALTVQLARQSRGYPIEPVWWHVLNWYISNHAKYGSSYTVLQSLYYRNEPENLSKETIEKLYPKQINTSVSRLESYYRCSYQHFAKYSLGLSERRMYKLDAPDIGQLFHEALKMITEWVQQEGRDFSDLSKKDAGGYAQKAISQLAPVLQHQILHSSNRYQYIQKKLQDVIARAAFVLSEQARKSHFSPVGLELGFGSNQPLKPVQLRLANGFELVLRGRIDRVDKALHQDQLLLRIIDYKSSDRGLNLLEVYYGLALQMLTYLDVVLSNSLEWLGAQASPAGVLYFHVHNPMINHNNKLHDDDIEQLIFKDYKMKGMLLDDVPVARMMDTSLDSGRSDILPVAISNKEKFYKNSKVADEETFHVLQQHIHELMMQAGIDITEGKVNLNPFQHKQNIACTFCPFLSVCQFDPQLESNNYHRFMEMKDEDILQKLKKEGGEA